MGHDYTTLLAINSHSFHVARFSTLAINISTSLHSVILWHRQVKLHSILLSIEISDSMSQKFILSLNPVSKLDVRIPLGYATFIMRQNTFSLGNGFHNDKNRTTALQPQHSLISQNDIVWRNHTFHTCFLVLVLYQ